jgi:hypothetical protein
VLGIVGLVVAVIVSEPGSVLSAAILEAVAIALALGAYYLLKRASRRARDATPTPTPPPPPWGR